MIIQGHCTFQRKYSLNELFHFFLLNGYYFTLPVDLKNVGYHNNIQAKKIINHQCEKMPTRWGLYDELL